MAQWEDRDIFNPDVHLPLDEDDRKKLEEYFQHETSIFKDSINKLISEDYFNKLIYKNKFAQSYFDIRKKHNPNVKMSSLTGDLYSLLFDKLDHKFKRLSLQDKFYDYCFLIVKSDDRHFKLVKEKKGTSKQIAQNEEGKFIEKRQLNRYFKNYSMVCSKEWVGRKIELDDLDSFWKSQNLTIINIIALGGFGKSALIGKWYERMVEQKWHNLPLEKYFYWSFYYDSSFDNFLENAIVYFSDNPNEWKDYRSRIAKINRLVELLMKSNNLLVFDGFEKMQHVGRGDVSGSCLDYELEGLIEKTASGDLRNTKLIITSRFQVGKIDNNNKVGWIFLENRPLSKEEATLLLQKEGIKGDEDELEKIASAVEYHPLALETISGLLLRAYKGLAENFDQEMLSDIARSGKTIKINRIMAFYDSILDYDEKVILWAISLSKRPITIEILLRILQDNFEVDDSDADKFSYLPPFISHIGRNKLINLIYLLEQTRLISIDHESDSIAMHELVRTHFIDNIPIEIAKDIEGKFMQTFYNVSKEYPDNLDEMRNLIDAIYHGCEAGRYSYARKKILVDRLFRGDKFYLDHILGETKVCLDIVLTFFPDRDASKSPYLRDPNSESMLLNEVALKYQQLGRYEESISPSKRGIKIAKENNLLHRAASMMLNLAYTYIYYGEIELAETEISNALKIIENEKEKMRYLQAKRNCLVCLALIQSIIASKQAENTFMEAEYCELEFNKYIQNPRKIKYLIFRRGCIYADYLLDIGKYDLASDVIEENIKHCEGERVKADISRVYRIRAKLNRLKGLYDNALIDIETAKDKADSMGWPELICEALLEKARIKLKLCCYDEIGSILKDVFRYCLLSKIPLFEAEAKTIIIHNYIQQNKTEQAKIEYDNALSIVERISYARLNRELQEIASRMKWERN